MNFFTWVMLALSCILLIPDIYSQDKVPSINLSGRCLAVSDDPILLATVVLLDVDTNYISGTNTDNGGQFELNISEEVTFLQVSSLEYKDTLMLLDKELSVPLEIVLEVDNHVLSQVEVTGKKPFLEQKEDRLIMNMSGAHSTGGSSALDLLSRVPGVVVNSQQGTVSLSGKDGVLIMINDRLTRVPLNVLLRQLEGMQADNVERIEIIHQPPAKYNAGGAGGILHLVFKKDETEGLNGNIGGMLGYGQREKYGANGDFNYHSGGVNLYGNVDYLYSLSDDKEVLTHREYRYQNRNYQHTIENFFSTQISRGLSGRAGLDYKAGEKSTFGFLAGFGDNLFYVDSDAYSKTMIDNQKTGDYVYDLKTTIANKYFYGNANFFHRFEKSNLNLDFDYAHYGLSSPGDFEFLMGEASAFASQFKVDRKNPIDIYTLKADYIYHFAKGSRLELGSKLSLSSIGNDADVQQFKNGEWLAHDEFSARDDIDENVYAAYFSSSTKISDKVSLEAGLRYEYFDFVVENSEQIVTFDQKYGSLFPVLRFNIKVDSVNNLQIGYNRRVNRPRYNQLGAQFVFIDPTSVTSGNPFLRPAFASAIRAAWTRKAVMLSLEATRTINHIAYRSRVIKEQNLFRDSPHNFDQFDIVGLTFSFPIHLASWSDIRLTTIGQYRRTIDIEGREAPIEKSKANFIWQYNQTFKLSKTLSGDLNVNRIANALDGDQVRFNIFNVSLGINKKFENGSSLNVSFMDIFNQAVEISMMFEQPALDLTTGGELRWSERQVRLSYKMPFGSNKVQKYRQRKTASEEERARAR